MTNVLALPAGTELVGDFRIERMLGAGGFGITYLAEETALARLVTIKEYFPSDLAARGEGQVALPRDPESQADYEWGLTRFIDEAQILARFDHPNIVKVYRYFRANDTAYMVLHFEEGQSLKAWLRGLGRHPRQREIDAFVEPLLEALETIHAGDYLHRDIAPDNIIIRKDGSPVLIDFGSARGDIASRSRTVSALVKPGYSPYEQYAENGVRQGPWTDIYALGATLYQAIAGKRPPDAPSRVVKDELIPAREAALASYRSGFLAAIDKALAIDTDRRPQSIAAWRGDLLAPDEAKPGWIRRQITRNAGASGAPAKTRALHRAPGAGPPPPDVPAAKGSLLDYLDGLKPKPDPAASPSLVQEASAAYEPAATADQPAVNPASRPPRSKPSQGQSGSKSVAEKLPVRVKPPRPQPVRWQAGGRWRSFAFKFLIGTGIAGAALGMQDKLPRVDVPRINVPGASMIASSFRDAPQRLPVLAGHRGGTAAVGFTADGRSVVTTGADGTLKIWNSSTGSLTRSLDLGDGPAIALAVSGRRALTGHSDGAIELWDIDSGSRLGRFKRNEASIWSLAFAGDQGRFVATSHDWAVTLWNAAAAEAPAAVIEGHGNSVQAVAYSGQGPYIATGSADKTVKLWRAGDLSLVRTYRGNKEYVTAVAFSPDGRYLASAALDGSIRVWHTSSNQLYRVSTGHKGRVAGLAFAPSGDTIASTGEDGSVRLWQIKGTRSIRTLSEQGSPSRALAFAPDGRRLAVASSDGEVRFWDATPPPTGRQK